MKSYRVIVVALALMLAGTAAGYGQQSAEELYQSGLYQEEVQGNLQSAIEVYERILEQFSDNRAVNARAQLHIGLCYEKLGLTEAQQAYQRVIDGYPERQDEVAVARERLARLTQALAELSSRPSFRKIEIASNPQNGVLSPDGTRLAFFSEGGLWVVPLEGNVDPDIAGEPTRIAEVPEGRDIGNLMAWSADGEWIAVNGRSGAVYVVPAGGGVPRVVRIPPRGSHAWNDRVSLSPDGQRLAFTALELGTAGEVRDAHEGYVYSMPTVGGEPTRVSSDRAWLPSYSPDGELIAYVGHRERDALQAGRPPYHGDLWVGSPAGANPVRLATADGRLRGPVWSPDGKYIAANHEPGGNNLSNEIWVFPLSPDASSAGEPTKIELPRSSLNMLAGWTPDGELGVFIETESHTAIYTVPASGGKAVQVMPDAKNGIWYPRWSPDGERIYLRPLAGADMVNYVPAAGGEPVAVPTAPRLVVVQPNGGFHISPDGRRVVFSAAQFDPPDLPREVDIWTVVLDGGSPTRLTNDGSREGYPCWSPDGKWVAFTDWHEESEGERFNAIYVVPAEGGEIRQISSESDSVSRGGAIAFSPDGERIAFFSDGAIKAIPLDGGQPDVLVAEAQSDGMSIRDLAWSPDGAKIAYGGAGKIWIASLGGGAPEELSTGLQAGTELWTFSWSPDGEKIAFVGSNGVDEVEFWLISDFLPRDR